MTLNLAGQVSSMQTTPPGLPNHSHRCHIVTSALSRSTVINYKLLGVLNVDPKTR